MFVKRIQFFILYLLVCSFTSFTYAFTLVIDAGHGGHDAGAIGTYSKEKNINLTVALKVGELIRNNCSDVKVIYTRDTDVFVDLRERANIANKAKADLFISIHTNALPKGRQAVGVETYSLGMARSNENLEVAQRENAVILYEDNYQTRYAGFNPKSSESYIIFEFMQDEFMKQSAELAKCIQDQYIRVGRPDKGVKQAGFLVLRETSMPSVLTELGFISTPTEEQYLNSPQGQNALARSIYNGFVQYKNAHSKSKTGTIINTPVEVAEPVQPQPEETVASTPIEEAKTVEKTSKTSSLNTTEQKVPSETPIATTPTNASTQKNPMVSYRVQLMTTSALIPKGSGQFKGYEKEISYYMDNGMYKYTCGNTQDYNEILAKRKQLASVFPGCFVIALKNDQRITIQEAQQLLK